MGLRMSAASSARTAMESVDLPEQRVTPRKLLYELVFALTRVTGFFTHHLTWTGMLKGAARGVGGDVGRTLVAAQHRARRGDDPHARRRHNVAKGRGS